MKYQPSPAAIPFEKRAEINDKILTLIGSSSMQGITATDVYNYYTGDGGLHGLQRKDFDSFKEYTEAKKDIEQGQFFTPPGICEQIASLISPGNSDTICDLTCGAGAFFNWFNEHNCYGCDIDNKAIKVAQYLYPDANIKTEDIKFYDPGVKVDFVIGNPPFNLKWFLNSRSGGIITSQEFFFDRSAELLKPGGMIVALVPDSFLKDEFFNKGSITRIQEHFDFICQYKLPDNSFESLGVKKFETKVMCWQRKSEHTEARPYSSTYMTIEQSKQAITAALEVRKSIKVKLHGEMLAEFDHTTEYKIRKYLFEIKAHRKLEKHLGNAIAYVEKFRTQKCPANMDREEWEKNHRISEKEVISYLRRTVAKQDKKEKHVIKLVKYKYGMKLKAYSEKQKRILNENYKVKNWSFNYVLCGRQNFGKDGMTSNYRKLFRRKEMEFELQSRSFNLEATKLNDKSMRMFDGPEFSVISTDEAISKYLREFIFIGKGKKLCKFNAFQLNDLNFILQKRFAILNWQQGCGKTPAAHAWAKYKPMRNTFIVSAALAINLTWKPYLDNHKEKYVQVKTLKDVMNLQPGVFVLLSFDFITRYEYWLKRYIKANSQKVNLIFDESDEITNHAAKRTRAILNIFRRVKRKLLATGTTTRNNITELYSQFELLYNNSINMLSTPLNYYVEFNTKENGRQIQLRENKYYMEPFPPYYGPTTFKRCFNPTKATVFGIQKHNQDLYNEEHLRLLIEKTIITRKFREIAGDKYEVQNTRVKQDYSEKQVYKKIIDDLSEILPFYFNPTGNSRKDSLLRIIRQLTLLIEATSTPQLFHFYKGSGIPNKAVKIFDLLTKYNEKVAIGCVQLKAVEWYLEQIKIRFPDRPLFKIIGDVSFKNRASLIEEFEATGNGILVCTQQSLKSSVNIPECNKVIVESLQWNIPKMEQFFFRFIRYDSENNTDVIFVNYEDTIEVNLLALLMAKERLNDYIKTLEYREESEIYNEFDIDLGILNELITKQKDEEGNIKIQWGTASAVA